MTKNRVFTDKELKDMGARTLDLVFEAIEAGDKKKAKDLAQRMYNEFNYLHDGYMVWVSGLQSWIYKNCGTDSLEKAEKEAHTIEGNTVFKSSGPTDFRSRVINQAGKMRGHLQPMEIVEDDEKVSITMKPCGSGERIISLGCYEAGLSRVKGPHRATWGQKDFPIYCVHCPVGEMLAMERAGYFSVVKIVSEPIGKEGCHFTLYKDNANIPEKYYQRIGVKKPAPKK
jgi:hypothetical protein